MLKVFNFLIVYKLRYKYPFIKIVNTTTKTNFTVQKIHNKLLYTVEELNKYGGHETVKQKKFGCN